ncbi:hypothetical protein AA313_de0209478 [Arthrobotrys entomopaga]|nr:hypothetical protein AA313_de0209478 [Arthrobotrys entomopaga]
MSTTEIDPEDFIISEYETTDEEGESTPLHNSHGYSKKPNYCSRSNQTSPYQRRRKGEVLPLPELTLTVEIPNEEDDIFWIGDKLYTHTGTQVNNKSVTPSEISENEPTDITIVDPNRHSRNLEVATQILQQIEMATYVQTETYGDSRDQDIPMYEHENLGGPSTELPNLEHSQYAPKDKGKGYPTYPDPDEDPDHSDPEPDHSGNGHESHRNHRPSTLRDDNIKLPEPIKFGGSPAKLDQFLRQLGDIFLLKPRTFDTGRKKVLYAGLFLEGTIFNTYNTYREQYDEATPEEQRGKLAEITKILTNYKEFTTFLRQTCGYKNKQEEALRKFHELKQTKSARSYFQELDQYIPLTDYNDEQILHHAKEGLKPQWRQEVIKQKINNKKLTYKEMQFLIIELDDALYKDNKANTARLRTPGPSNSNNSRPPQRPQDRPPNPRPSQPNQGQPRFPNTQRPQNQWQRNDNGWTPRATFGPAPMDLGTTQNRPNQQRTKPPKSNKPVCFNCNKEGHMARNCTEQNPRVNQRPKQNWQTKQLRNTENEIPQEQHEQSEYGEESQEYEDNYQNYENEYEEFEPEQEPDREFNVATNQSIPPAREDSMETTLQRIQAALIRTRSPPPTSRPQNIVQTINQNQISDIISPRPRSPTPTSESENWLDKVTYDSLEQDAEWERDARLDHEKTTGEKTTASNLETVEGQAKLWGLEEVVRRHLSRTKEENETTDEDTDMGEDTPQESETEIPSPAAKQRISEPTIDEYHWLWNNPAPGKHLRYIRDSLECLRQEYEYEGETRSRLVPKDTRPRRPKVYLTKELRVAQQETNEIPKCEGRQCQSQLVTPNNPGGTGYEDPSNPSWPTFIDKCAQLCGTHRCRLCGTSEICKKQNLCTSCSDEVPTEGYYFAEKFRRSAHEPHQQATYLAMLDLYGSELAQDFSQYHFEKEAFRFGTSRDMIITHHRTPLKYANCQICQQGKAIYTAYNGQFAACTLHAQEWTNITGETHWNQHPNHRNQHCPKCARKFYTKRQQELHTKECKTWIDSGSPISYREDNPTLDLN